jgi:CTP synthase
LDKPDGECKVAIVGKYVDVIDSYKSINEALIHAGISNNSRVNVKYIDAAGLTKDNVEDELKSFDGVIVPGGFGNRGVEGKINTIQFLRENNVPFLGICLGMQLACIEFARNKLELSSTDSQEFSTSASNPVIHLMADQKDVTDLGGTMRLGAYPCKISQGTKAFAAYGSLEISERHRHRYEFNNHYREAFQNHGMQFSGVSPDDRLVEMVELDNHPWFVACQFHPELKSSPMEAHPLFRDFVKACLNNKGI